MTDKPKVLVADDDKKIAQFIKTKFEENGIKTTLAHDGKEALFLINTNDYDVAVVDWIMPYLDGISLLKILRKQNVTIPVIILSALDSTENKIQGLTSGSDDYLTKPFSIDELIVRVNTLYRRTKQIAEAQSHKLTCGDIILDELAHEVRRNDELILLQQREYKVLHLLLKHKNEVVSKTMILKEVWDYDFDPQTNVVEVHISHLRNKLTENGLLDPIKTIRGFGYVIQE
ncbi:two-component system response regulator BfpR [Francisella orientalis]|uniref:DNA-binding response regulator n=1 Tax=Francisella orientalis TaxID=299583 RepID=A0AAP7KJH0_9GAMM|nr:response regulator transcription factor [Francisella orientalis]AFJ43254.1 response regulator receiver protein [Francisella orientalis str. Toba 04]AHB98808.1 regulator [Francisella orientalis LADL 07-285A]AKN86083.1 Response regulator receiver protein [Francisella orientalis FNO12]AKN87621.1 Response regulator receiver protein [Francisella orientalis FNO24]AKN89159.1 Response regulator receiver protein [Francisella orientalis]